MIEALVEKTMKGALKGLAENEIREPNAIQLMIRGHEGGIPTYFYTVDGAVKMENGQRKNLEFRKDILRVKMDMLNQEAIAGSFLINFFNSTAKKAGVEQSNIYVGITAADEEGEELKITLYKGKEREKMTLADIFEDNMEG